jgi:hypothetical protein
VPVEPGVRGQSVDRERDVFEVVVSDHVCLERVHGPQRCPDQAWCPDPDSPFSDLVRVWLEEFGEPAVDQVEPRAQHDWPIHTVSAYVWSS